MPAPRIKTVSSGLQRGEAYAVSIRRYNAAMRQGFYYEGLLISYALIEDRLRSILYHLGVLSERGSERACKKVRRQVLATMASPSGEKGPRLAISTMDGKIRIIRAITKWSLSCNEAPQDDPYLRALWVQHRECGDALELLGILDQVDTWRGARNEVVHALLNKDAMAAESATRDLCEEGFALFRALDTHVGAVSHVHRIRRALKLRTDGKH